MKNQDPGAHLGGRRGFAVANDTTFDREVYLSTVFADPVIVQRLQALSEDSAAVNPV